MTQFQQLSAPIAAKAVEDTAFYRYGRLLSRNDVGFDVARFSDSALLPFLRERIEAYFKAENVPVVMRYFDPSYIIRSSPASAEDSILCDLFARNAAHAAMAGKTGLVIGFLHEKFIHVPMEMLTSRKKTMNPESLAWGAVLAATGQPERFE